MTFGGVAPPRLAPPIRLPAPGGVASPFQFTLTGDEHLRMRSHNSLSGVTVTLQGRFFTPDQQTLAFSFNHTPNTDRSLATDIFALGPGALANVICFASAAAPLIGQCFVKVEVIRGRTGAVIALGTVIQGYITASQALAWPGSSLAESTDGEPLPRVVTGTNPAAGGEISETVPTGARWTVWAIRATLVTGASGGSQAPRIAYDDGSTTFYEGHCHSLQGANISRTYHWSIAGPDIADVISSARNQSIPAGLWLPAGSRILTATANLGVDDDWGAPTLSVGELLEAAA